MSATCSINPLMPWKSCAAWVMHSRCGPAGPELGLLVVGNEAVLHLFEPRRGNYFGRWRDRIEQKEVRVLGPSKAEAREIVRAELGEGLPAQVIDEPVERCTVKDPVSGKQYVSTHRLFHALEAFRRKRGVN